MNSFIWSVIPKTEENFSSERVNTLLEKLFFYINIFFVIKYILQFYILFHINNPYINQ